MVSVIDTHNREALGIGVDFSLPSDSRSSCLGADHRVAGKPAAMCCGYGLENVSGLIQAWADRHSIWLDYILSGKPLQNAHVERCNWTVRYEWLSQYYWEGLGEVRPFATE